jgi:hypothetical protein
MPRHKPMKKLNTAQTTVFQASGRDQGVLSGHGASEVFPGRTEDGARKREATWQTPRDGEGKSQKELAPRQEQKLDPGQQPKMPSRYGRGV